MNTAVHEKRPELKSRSNLEVLVVDFQEVAKETTIRMNDLYSQLRDKDFLLKEAQNVNAQQLQQNRQLEESLKDRNEEILGYQRSNIVLPTIAIAAIVYGVFITYAVWVG
jgi:hypothetical protein